MQMPAPVQLPDRLGRWIWDNRQGLPGMEIVDVSGNSAVLAFDLEDLSNLDENLDPIETGRGYVYVEADGSSQYSELVDADAKGATPLVADFRTCLMLQADRDALLASRVHELERFRKNTIQVGLLLAAAALMVVLVR